MLFNSGAQRALRRSRYRGRYTTLLASLLAVTTISPVSRATQPAQGTSSLQAREEAVRSIPFEQLNEQLRPAIWSVASQPSLYRRLPVQTVQCDPDMYMFLVRYPEVMVNIWQLMGVTKMQVKRTGPFSVEGSDGSGTNSQVQLVYGRPDLHIYYASGHYEGALLRNRINGNAVMVLRANYSHQGGHALVTHVLDVFVKLDHAGAEVVAKTFQSFVGKAADFNFVESTRFIGQICQASATNGPGMQRLAARLTNVDPTVRQSLSQYAEVVYQRAVLRNGMQPAAVPQFAPGPALSSGVVPAGGSAMMVPVPSRYGTPQYHR
jgi:hypothetical protein